MTDAELVAELTARRDYHRDQAERLEKAIEALKGDEAAPAPRRGGKATAKPKAKEGEQRPRPTGMGTLKEQAAARVQQLRAWLKDEPGLTAKQAAEKLGVGLSTGYALLAKAKKGR